MIKRHQSVVTYARCVAHSEWILWTVLVSSILIQHTWPCTKMTLQHKECNQSYYRPSLSTFVTLLFSMHTQLGASWFSSARGLSWVESMKAAAEKHKSVTTEISIWCTLVLSRATVKHYTHPSQQTKPSFFWDKHQSETQTKCCLIGDWVFISYPPANGSSQLLAKPDHMKRMKSIIFGIFCTLWCFGTQTPLNFTATTSCWPARGASHCIKQTCGGKLYKPSAAPLQLYLPSFFREGQITATLLNMVC